MTDADKLRMVADGLPDYCSVEKFHLRRIAERLDAVPSETLTAIKAGTWKATPVEPTEDQRRIARRYFGLSPFHKDRNPMDHLLLSAYKAMLSVAPTKP